MKYKPYKKMKKALFAGASSGIVASMFLVGSSTVFADTTNYSASAYTQNTSVGMHMMRRWNGRGKAGVLAGQLGLDRTVVNEELKSGKTMKQILQENGIVPGQLQKAIMTKKMGKNWKN